MVIFHLHQDSSFIFILYLQSLFGINEQEYHRCCYNMMSVLVYDECVVVVDFHFDNSIYFYMKI